MSAPVSARRPLPPCLAVVGKHGALHLYHEGEHNRCPSCGQTQWHVGRIVATCARCEMHLPLVTPPVALPDELFRQPEEMKVA